MVKNEVLTIEKKLISTTETQRHGENHYFSSVSPYLRGNSGFSLLELLITIILMGIVTTILVIFFRVQLTALTQNYNRFRAIQKSWHGLNLLVNEIKNSSGIIEGERNYINVWGGDINHNRRIDEDEIIQYLFKDRKMVKLKGAQSRIMFKHTKNIEFFYDEPPPETRHIIIQLTIDTPRKETILNTSAHPRNMIKNIRRF